MDYKHISLRLVMSTKTTKMLGVGISAIAFLLVTVPIFKGGVAYATQETMETTIETIETTIETIETTIETMETTIETMTTMTMTTMTMTTMAYN